MGFTRAMLLSDYAFGQELRSLVWYRGFFRRLSILRGYSPHQQNHFALYRCLTPLTLRINPNLGIIFPKLVNATHMLSNYTQSMPRTGTSFSCSAAHLQFHEPSSAQSLLS